MQTANGMTDKGFIFKLRNRIKKIKTQCKMHNFKQFS